jgi:GntR family transcriptional regulator
MTVNSSAARSAPAPSPQYLSIAADLRERIQAGELAPHQGLPPERELCQQYEVSRMTARRALVVLEGEGLVYRSATRGTFVAEPRLQLRLGSFSEEVSRSGHRPGASVLWAEERPAGSTPARMLGVEEGTVLHVLQRLRRVDDEPIALETTYYPASLTPGLLTGDLSGSLWAELRERYDTTPARTVATIEVVGLDADAARHLNTREAAGGLQLVRQTFDHDGACLEYAQDVYRADRVAFTIERSVTPE